MPSSEGARQGEKTGRGRERGRGEGREREEEREGERDEGREGERKGERERIKVERGSPPERSAKGTEGGRETPADERDDGSIGSVATLRQ